MRYQLLNGKSTTLTQLAYNDWLARKKPIKPIKKKRKNASKRVRFTKDTRLIVRSRLNCEVCGDIGVCIHHIDKDSSNNKLDNLQLLCTPCHKDKHPSLPSCLFNISL